MNNNLNDLVRTYQKTRDDETFTEIYRNISRSWRNLNTVAKSIRADIHEVTEVYHRVLMKCVDEYDGQSDFLIFFLRAARNGRADLYRKKTAKKELNVIYEESSERNETMAATIENIPDESSVEEVVIATRKADQRQLIDSLVSEADELTTAIVNSFLAHPKPTPTAIGKELGLHHSTVIRKLERLAGKFDSKKHGDYRDFLVAI